MEYNGVYFVNALNLRSNTWIFGKHLKWCAYNNTSSITCDVTRHFKNKSSKYSKRNVWSNSMRYQTLISWFLLDFVSFSWFLLYFFGLLLVPVWSLFSGKRSLKFIVSKHLVLNQPCISRPRKGRQDVFPTMRNILDNLSRMSYMENLTNSLPNFGWIFYIFPNCIYKIQITLKAWRHLSWK